MDIKNEHNTKRTSARAGYLSRIFKNPWRVLGVLVGLGIILFPTISNYITRNNNNKIIAAYSRSYHDNQQVWDAIDEYNKWLKTRDDPLSMVKDELAWYGKIYDAENTEGLIGHVDIEKINVHLPIYLGTHTEKDGEAVLHLPGTSLPSDKPGTNVAISGHTGHPISWLFSDLDQLKVGDEFEFTSLNLTFKYKVCDVSVVLPTDVENVLTVSDKNYCTLVTCTPFGINSHRLLVRGELQEIIEADHAAAADKQENSGNE